MLQMRGDPLCVQLFLRKCDWSDRTVDAQIRRDINSCRVEFVDDEACESMKSKIRVANRIIDA